MESGFVYLSQREMDIFLLFIENVVHTTTQSPSLRPPQFIPRFLPELSYKYSRSETVTLNDPQRFVKKLNSDKARYAIPVFNYLDAQPGSAYDCYYFIDGKITWEQDQDSQYWSGDLFLHDTYSGNPDVVFFSMDTPVNDADIPSHMTGMPCSALVRWRNRFITVRNGSCPDCRIVAIFKNGNSDEL
ncbi:hypothetical protein [uncultured Desulfuromusa sp.]|uniref:hypothetical protein n=1 Tax=uncultured Desulfuromusa sp. TaxID=219183 RepID=UPI002AA8588F|nr:hypothetical protein [uncultured Desulfuromusa sp.]